MAFDHSKFLARFVEEAREHCSRISEGLLNIESSPDDAELLNSLFRSAHTIKGSSRMMKLSGITELAHHMEDVLDAVRGRKISLASSVSAVLFQGVDTLQGLLEAISGGDNTKEAPQQLLQALAQAANAAPEINDTPASSSATSSPEPAPVPSGVSPSLPAEQAIPSGNTPAVMAMETQKPETKGTGDDSHAAPKVKQAEYLRINASKLDDLIRLMGEIVSEHGRTRRHIARMREIERSVARHCETVSQYLNSNSCDCAEIIEAGDALQLSLRQSVRAMYDASLMQDHLVGDLQETSLKMRMQPLSTVFDPLRRTVRDLAIEHGKEMNFIVEGGDTELDRKIIDRIGDSLIHMIRNSLDHGLESSSERIAAGKHPKGTITLSAFYDSGCVTICLSDDGRGLSMDRIREKALSKKLFEADVLAGMSRAEILNLIFMPGFSTSPIITDLSGRGVGMDVVRKSIVDELKGTIIIESKEGIGTSFLLRLPLNLAVFPLFFLSAGGKVCALPATSIVEMLSIRNSEIIEIVNKRAIRLREQIIPVEELAAILRLPHETGPDDLESLIVIIRDGEDKLGLIVEEIVGREEMVVKPLPQHLQNLRMVSGVTLGERNSIINILHVPEILRQAREISDSGRAGYDGEAEKDAVVLVVDDSINTRELEKSILEAYGYTVVTAEDGVDGWDKTRDKVFDLVITDVEMPRLDGFSLTERLREDERYRDVPIMIVTSREKEEDKRRGIQVGANAYIVKGTFDQSNLLETVRSLIG